MAARHDAEAASVARCRSLSRRDRGRRPRREHNSHGQLVGQAHGRAQREREIFDPSTVRPAAGHERVGSGFAQQPVEVVEMQHHEPLPPETGQIDVEHLTRVHGALHAGNVVPRQTGVGAHHDVSARARRRITAHMDCR